MKVHTAYKSKKKNSEAILSIIISNPSQTELHANFVGAQAQTRIQEMLRDFSPPPFFGNYKYYIFSYIINSSYVSN